MAATPSPCFRIASRCCSSSTSWILQNGHQSAERKNTSMAPFGPMMDLRVWFRPSWSRAEKSGTCWPASGPVLMIWPCDAAIRRVQIANSMRGLFAIQARRLSERERILFGDHDNRRATRRYLHRMCQGFLASGRRRALLERLHGWKMNLRNAVKLRFALRRLQDLRGDHFDLSWELRDRHRHVLFLINLFESRGVLGLRIRHDQLDTLHPRSP